MTGITEIGTYLPRTRLSRSAITAATGWLTPSARGVNPGTRTLGFWDEDPVTMAVAAARLCLAGIAPGSRTIRALDFASTTAPFAERQNASLVHGALTLGERCLTQDLAGTPRAALAALHRLLESGDSGLVVGADRPVAPAGSAAELRYGDGAAAALVGADAPLFLYDGGISTAAGFTDRYRAAGETIATEWEERWVRDEAYGKLLPETIAAALSAAGCAADAIDHFVLASPLPAIGAWVACKAGLDRARIADPLADISGFTGCGHALLMLAAAMETIAPGDRILLCQVGQGATALVLQATERVRATDTGFSLRPADTILETSYLKLPVFSGLLPWDKGLRGRSRMQEALTTAARYEPAILGFVGGRCRETGAVQFPPSRLSANRQHPALDTQDPYPLADVGGVIASRTADALAFSPAPPSCYGLVDFHGGGRLMMDFTDPDAGTLVPGDEVRFVFRIKESDETTGYRRYFWKAVRACPAKTTRHTEERHAERA